MKIGIDVDDVCANFQDAYVRLLNKLYGRPPIGTAPIDWAGSNLQLSPEETKQSWEEVAKVPDFWYKLAPLPSFDYETVKLLKIAHYDHDVFFITNRFPTPGRSPLHQTKEWFDKNTTIYDPNVLIASSKGPVAQVLQLDYFFDDRPKNCTDVLAARPETKVFLADSSHNKTFTHPEIPRLSNLKEFLKTIGVR